jgi:HEAT repeat protein
MARLTLATVFVMATGCSSGPVPNLMSGDPYERFLGALEAADSGEPEAIPKLVALLKDRDPLARIGAMVSLVRVQHPDLVKLLTGMLKDPDPGVRAEAARTLGSIKHPSSVEPLIALLAGDPAPEARRVAALALGNYPDSPAIREALLNAYGDREAGVAFNAFKSLVRITGKPTLPRDRAAAEEALKR